MYKLILYQVNLHLHTVNNTRVFRHPVTSDKNYDPKVFMFIKIKPEYSNILYNPTHLPGPFVCRIRHVPLYIS